MQTLHLDVYAKPQNPCTCITGITQHPDPRLSLWMWFHKPWHGHLHAGSSWSVVIAKVQVHSCQPCESLFSSLLPAKHLLDSSLPILVLKISFISSSQRQSMVKMLEWCKPSKRIKQKCVLRRTSPLNTRTIPGI